VTTVAGKGRESLLPVQAGALDHLRATHVHAATRGVRHAGVQQRSGELDDLRHVGVRAGLVRGPADRQGVHVVVEVELLHGGKPVVLRAHPAGRVEQHVIDVGHVTADLDLDAEPAQQAVGRIHPHERGGVAQVGHVVRRHTADVDARPPDDGQLRTPQAQAVRRRFGHATS